MDERRELERALNWYHCLYLAGEAGGNGKDEVLEALAKYVLELGQSIDRIVQKVAEIEARV